MKQMKMAGLSLVVALACMVRVVHAGEKYTVDSSHATVSFTIAHMVISKVQGMFPDVSGSIEVGESGQLLAVEGAVQVKSINTGNAKRDEHLVGADFFDAATHPAMSFKSSGVATQVDGKWVLEGDLTIRGVTKRVSAPYVLNGPITDPWGKVRMAVETTLTIKRSDYGLTWNAALEAGGVAVGDEVTITLSVEGIKEDATPVTASETK